MNILIIDNYDSYTYNLYQVVGVLCQDRFSGFGLDVVRNDKITLKEIITRAYDRIILSPGPGSPADYAYFGVCSDVIVKLGKSTPIFGVCLGMQGIAHYFGGSVIHAKKTMHGKSSIISHTSEGVFSGIPQKVSVMRYHSLVVSPESLPSCLCITARSIDTDEIMGLRHTKYPIQGVQFHPESFATETGTAMIQNFIDQTT